MHTPLAENRARLSLLPVFSQSFIRSGASARGSLVPRRTVDWDISQADDSAMEVCHGRAEGGLGEAGRRGATARVRRSVTRPGWANVAAAQDGGGHAAVARRGSRDRVARPRGHSGDADDVA